MEKRNIILLYAVYNRLTLDPRTQRGSKWKIRKRVHENSNWKRNWVDILILTKTGVNIKLVTIDKEEHYMIKSQFIKI